jgi:hypothetical protein
MKKKVRTASRATATTGVEAIRTWAAEPSLGHSLVVSRRAALTIQLDRIKLAKNI